MSSWKCKKCSYSTEWSDKEVAEKGMPVCPNCDIDLELDKKRITREDIDTILLAGKIIDNVAKKYEIKGNLGQIYVEALNQSYKEGK